MSISHNFSPNKRKSKVGGSVATSPMPKNQTFGQPYDQDPDGDMISENSSKRRSLKGEGVEKMLQEAKMRASINFRGSIAGLGGPTGISSQLSD